MVNGKSWLKLRNKWSQLKWYPIFHDDNLVLGINSPLLDLKDNFVCLLLPAILTYTKESLEQIEQMTVLLLDEIALIDEILIHFPKEIVVEAIVNAIAHRDYTNNGSVQVMLFKDRLEISNPGSIPLGWTIEKLKGLHTSVPANPLLAEPMYLNGYIERLGTGTSDIIRIARKSNLPEPIFEQHEEFITTIYRPSTDQVPTKFRPSF